MSRVFLDTNVVAYQFDASEPEKQALARRALATEEHSFVVSTQVVLELYQVITRKLSPPVPPARALDVLHRLADLPVVTADSQLVLRAAGTSAQHQLSIWDAMIIEAAVDAGCDEVWSEDLNPGALRGITVVDPFASR